jgi:hypothetical protein
VFLCSFLHLATSKTLRPLLILGFRAGALRHPTGDFLSDMHIYYSLHSIDCNLADGEYILVSEQGVAQEVAQEPAPEPTIVDLPAPALEGKPRFYA